MSSHAELQAEIRLALGRYPDLRLWLNASGEAWQGHTIKIPGAPQGTITLANPRRIAYGVARPGGADFLAIRRVLITRAMVGRTFGQFGAVEVKPTAKSPFEAGQREFLAFVEEWGGFAGVARSVADAVSIVTTESEPSLRRPVDPETLKINTAPAE